MRTLLLMAKRRDVGSIFVLDVRSGRVRVIALRVLVLVVLVGDRNRGVS